MFSIEYLILYTTYQLISKVKFFYLEILISKPYLDIRHSEFKVFKNTKILAEFQTFDQMISLEEVHAKLLNHDDNY